MYSSAIRAWRWPGVLVNMIPKRNVGRTYAPLLGAILFGVVITGCGSQKVETLGKPALENASVERISGLAIPDKPTVIRGKMIEKCPMAGCWFNLKDGSGVIKVDTKDAGFVVTEVPLNTEVTVYGSLAKSGEKRIMATGIRY